MKKGLVIRMRKFILTLSAITLMVFMSACNIKEKINESISEKLLEEAAGEGTDVDINGEDVTVSTDEGKISIDSEEGITYEGEDGSVVQSGGEYEWPKDQAAAYIPELGAGTVSYILNGADTCMLTVGQVTLDDYKSYKEAVTYAGYTENKTENSSEDMELYSGTSGEGISVTIFFTPSQENINITVDASGKQ